MIATLAALVILDLAMLGVGQTGAVGPGWLLAGHAVLSAIAYARWLRHGTAIGLAPAILGALGPVGLLVGVLAHRPSASAAKTVDEDEAVFGPMPARHRHRGAMLAVARMLDGRVHHGEPETAHSLVTMMRHGDVGDRRRALETVVRSFQPALSPLVALALTDSDQTIRALAAAASARVVQNLALSRAAIEARVAAGTDPEAHDALATLLADHARANVLLSDSQRAHLRADAVAIRMADGDTEQDDVLVEAMWAAGDYAAIDRLALADADADADPGTTRTTAAGLGWWRSELAA
ncbi:hypothetical protein ASE75_04445 [Sphingomonas sp. Leaf17]|uniref:hypothetical protein n=1 Tax=Sphingomonas sp. Leaf17 TaxID=1735683 RepID=UPI0006FB7644|nr:hypothetical protein [Sphingomonas sp. Leaf17]KQM65518.1 hypothetical protein ASE75_04445 [Sphingomonas sp. Leaf17]